MGKRRDEESKEFSCDGIEEELRHRIEMLTGTQRQLTSYLEELSERTRIWECLAQRIRGLAFAVNKDYKLLYVNPGLSVRRNTGAASLTGFEFLENLDWEERKELSIGLSHAFQNANVSAFDDKGSWTYLPVRDAAGEVEFVVVLTRRHGPEQDSLEVSEPTEGKERSEVEMREEVFGLSSLIFEVNLQGTIVYANKKMREGVGSHLVVSGNDYNVLKHDDVPARWWKRLWDAARCGRVSSAMMKLKSTACEACWVDMTVVPVRNAGGDVVKYVAACYRFENNNIASYLFYQQINRIGEEGSTRQTSLS